MNEPKEFMLDFVLNEYVVFMEKKLRNIFEITSPIIFCTFQSRYLGPTLGKACPFYVQQDLLCCPTRHTKYWQSIAPLARNMPKPEQQENEKCLIILISLVGTVYQKNSSKSKQLNFIHQVSYKASLKLNAANINKYFTSVYLF